MSSKPTTPMSAGTRRPRSCSERSTPSAMWSSGYALGARLAEASAERPHAGDAHRVAGVVGGALDAEQRRRRPVQRGVEADHAERARAPGDERAGHAVRAVAEFA